MTSKPAPEGMIKVDVWSSNAILGQYEANCETKDELTIAVGIRANRLDIFRVLCGLTLAGRVVLSCTAILRFVVLGASGKARVEVRAFDVIVRIRIYTITRLIRGSLLKIPGTPFGHLIVVHLLFPGQRERSICVEKVGIFGIWVVSFLCKQARCTLTRRVCKVGRNVVECDVLEGLEHQCHWEIVTVD